MASVPPRQRTSPRRSSPPVPAPSSAAHTTPLPRSHSQAPSSVSEDSDTVLLNNQTGYSAASPEEGRKPQHSESKETSEKQEAKSGLSTQEDGRTCWICFGDESEDTPRSSGWRDPCPCALQAHESCLLDWVTDIETSNSRKRSRRRARLECPQCKSEIRLTRPHDPLVELVKAAERVASTLVVPGVLGAVGGTFVAGCFVHGVSSVYAVFGQADADRILAPFMSHRFILHTLAIAEQSGLLPQESLRSLHSLLAPMEHVHSPSWRLGIGLPLIPPILILSRFTVADGILPVLPVLFFATQPHGNDHNESGIWPPSAAVTLAVLPYVRGLYNEYYERVWGHKVRKWTKEVQPRNAEDPSTMDSAAAAEGTQMDDAEAAAGLGDLEGGGVEVQIEIGLDIFGTGDDVQEAGRAAGQGAADDTGTSNQHHARAHRAPALNAPPVEAETQNEPQQPAPAQAPPQPAELAEEIEERLVIPTGRVADSVLGALLFPSISAIMGELLKHSLPKSWVSPTLAEGKPVPTGLLQAKWGRSIVGGCLFVVLKDAIMLYVKWKQAQNHRKRRIMQYDKRTKRYLSV